MGELLIFLLVLDILLNHGPQSKFLRFIFGNASLMENSFLVFPGGFLPTLTFLMETLSQGSSGRLIVDSVSNIGPHYARTLREWRRRFLAKFDSVIVPSLQREYPEVMGGPRGREEIEVFQKEVDILLVSFCHASSRISKLTSICLAAVIVKSASLQGPWVVRIFRLW